MKIVITRRTDDIHACLEGCPAIWGCGKTSDEAIGNLISTHPETFGIEIKVPTR
jgi:hypothetical protein